MVFGEVYLAGPYKGAPLSLVIVTPVVAGPFDLGNVVIRTALHVDPKTAQVRAISDPIPTILHGIPLRVRDIRVSVDRPEFTLNPTSCEEMSIDVTAFGANGAVAPLSNRFQVGDCAALGFKPRLNLRLLGGIKRGKHPALRAVLRPRSGDANIAGTSVTLPRSAFLENAHIRTICTRVQFAAKQCPLGSIYGSAVAESPLLDDPLTGPVYLRSSNNTLPDLVIALKGSDTLPIEIELVGRIDSVKGGIRTTFDSTPDAPVSRFALSMQGGKKGLIVNSRNLCASTNRANVRMNGHNGRRHDFRPVVQPVNCKKQRKAVNKGKKGKAAKR